MGTGTGAAIESADITLPKDDLRGILRADLSAATMRNIRQNLFFAFVYNLVVVPMAVGVLYPNFWRASFTDDCKRGDDFQFGFGYLRCVTAQKFEVVIRCKNKIQDNC